jgi:hypothetical protein
MHNSRATPPEAMFRMALTFETPGLSDTATGSQFSFAANLKRVAYWLTLGAAAGGLGGAIAGGIGGRFAMFVLRLTSDGSVDGLISDDGFTIGRFDFLDTAGLVLVTTALGTIVGLLVVAGRPFFPARRMPFAWGLAGAAAGGALLVHQDGVDFTLLEPHWLAVALFVAVPGLGAGLIAWLTELYPRFWWRNWRATVAAGGAGLPVVVGFPIAVAAILGGTVWALAMTSPRLRPLPRWRPARIAADAVFALVVGIGAVDLFNDAAAII